MYRFKPSKFKNATCIAPKRETWLSDIRIGSPSSCGNHIKASCAVIAFNSDSAGGGSLGILDVTASGRQSQTMPVLHAHSSLVTDFDFSPFNDLLLATCSQDKSIKIWELPEGGLTDGVSNPLCTFSNQDRRVENVLFHPTASNILAASINKTVKIFDLLQEQEAIAMDVSGDQLQGISWKLDGTVLATTAKDKKIRILDPRASSVASETNGHASIKDSRVCWLGSKDQIISTGFGTTRERELKVWDVRNFESACATQRMGQSTGIMIPLYEPDSGLLFLCGKGDQRIGVYEISDASKISEGLIYSSDLQQRGVALVPKRMLDVMSCEVSRILQLTKQAIVPLKVEVPRVSHRDFFPELFPDTAGDEAALTSDQWLAGQDGEVAKISLDPAKRKASARRPLTGQQSASASENDAKGEEGGGDAPMMEQKREPDPEPANMGQASSANVEVATPEPTPAKLVPMPTQPAPEPTPAKLVPMPTQPAPEPAKPTTPTSPEPSPQPAPSASGAAAPKKKFTMMQTSKYRHMQGTLGQRKTHIINIRNASINVFGECDGFHANKHWAAVPLGGSAGLIAIIDITKPGKLPETGVPTIQNGTTMADFAWDPFDDNRLVAACIDAKVRVWSFGADGFEGTLTDPDLHLAGHEEKIYLIKFHPTAKDVLLSASYDMTVKIWDLSTGNEMLTLSGHTDQIFSAAWSPDGKQIATACKDGLIRVYEPRRSSTPVREGPGPEGSRGARIVWVHNGEFLFTSGFHKDSSRRVSLYSSVDLSKPLETMTVDRSPATLIPFYDPDTHVIVMTGKGERVSFCYEVLKEPPYFLPLSSYSSPSPQQAFSFLPKTVCNVKDVEFLRALKLSKTTIEPIYFTLLRVKKEYFQDDIFPDTTVTWEPALTSSEWFGGSDGKLGTMSLCPEGMKHLTSIPKAGPAPKKYTSEQELTYKTDAEKKEEIMAAMTNKLALKSDPLPQDEFEGVDEEEWDDY